ncbi:site-specific integrase [Neoroseomonas oryzicola]|uniref:Tyrosine-type recombinase/integrase n=1 Tax=Neoroseomonas oryzicola TaxID=535904 RepID=A0A9X9WDH2_9PROT|nr:tyrosine-type recombinase/integrase [Neoroseomonas oryzicola]MBR0658382.1 tyrosine-type recombinase/integrase [Neoroseomonas oryzicola]NKE18547.1 tyrosine-type recombinase/integrase [Neoroseomonas oryzicola]
MARKTTAAGRLENRTQRARLPAQRNPHWMLIAPQTHLGYRSPSGKGRNGTWVARRAITKQGDRTRYLEKALGTADDHPDSVADGAISMTFHQASAAARDWSVQQSAEDRAKASGADLTVKEAIGSYVASRKRRAAAAGKDAEWRLARHVLTSPLADVSLLGLTEDDFARWQRGVKRGGREKRSDVPLAPSTLARLLNDLRAALTAAARRAKAPTGVHAAIFEGTRPPAAAQRARPMQVVADADVRKLVAAADAHDPDFGALIYVLAVTGARFSQAARLTVGDLQPDAGRILIPPSAKGRGTRKAAPSPAPLPPDTLVRLRQIAAGRAAHEPLLMRWRHKQVPGPVIRWERKDRVAWSDSSEITRPWAKAVRTAGLAGDLVAYCLRHSSIVRGLRAGLPVQLVAKAHDTSAKMIESHYAAYIVDASEDLLRRAAFDLTSQ